MPKPGKAKTASKDKARAPFELNGVSALPGKLTHVELPVARLPTGMWLSLPVGVMHGTEPGPVIWVSAAIHGDELNGVSVIRHVLERIEPTKLRGTLLTVPVVNVFGLLQESRYLPDRRDLNRSFPGSNRGSAASQLAHLFMTNIVERCELGIDLHTGSGGRTNLPQVRCDLDNEKTASLAREFGASVLLHSRLRDGSLREAATSLGKTMLLYEAGEASRFDADAIEVGTGGVLRVMKVLGMTDAVAETPALVPRVARKSGWVRAQRSGFCEMTARLGAEVAEGDHVAIVFDALGLNRSHVRARTAGIIIGHSTSPIVHRGEAIAHIAEV